MIIKCKSCGTNYEVADDLVSVNGSNVRCSNCSNVFTVHRPTGDDKALDFSEPLGFGEEAASSEYEQTSVFENKVEGMIDGFDTEPSFQQYNVDETREIDLQLLEETAIISFQEIEVEDKAASPRNEDEKASEDVPEEVTDFGLETMAEMEVGEDGEEEIDLRNIDQQPISTLEAEQDIQEEFNLDLDEEDGAGEREYEIDLIEQDSTGGPGTSEFGLDLGGDDSPVEAAQGPATERDFTVELDFEAEEVEDLSESTGAEAQRQSNYQQDTLDIDLDLDGFDEEEAPAAASAEDDDFEFDLDLDLDLEAVDAPTHQESSPPPAGEEEEFDLTNVDEFLDLDGDGQPTVEKTDKDFDIGIETVVDATWSTQTAEKDFDLELITENDGGTHDSGTIDDISMATAAEIQGELDPDPPVAHVDSSRAKSSDIGEGTFKTGQVIGEKQSRPGLRVALALLLLVVLAGGGYYLYDTQRSAPLQTVQGPAPVMTDRAGKFQIAISRPEYRFIDNERSGEILVVSGSVTNRYDHSRKEIQVKGNFYNREGDLLFSSAPVYAGLMVEDSDLLTKEAAEIESGLTRAATAEPVSQVGSNQTIPFTIVISSFGTEVDELSVEVVSSAAADQ